MTEEPTAVAPAVASDEATVVAAPEAPPKRGFFRSVFRPAVVWSLVAALIIAGDAWMFVTVRGWSGEEASLRHDARRSAAKIAGYDAILASQSELLDVLQAQSQDAQDYNANLHLDAQAESDASDIFKQAALAYKRCGDQRAAAIAAAWVGNSTSTQIAAANAECATAKTLLATATAGD